jgi:hypothetical protein
MKVLMVVSCRMLDTRILEECRKVKRYSSSVHLFAKTRRSAPRVAATIPWSGLRRQSMVGATLAVALGATAVVASPVDTPPVVARIVAVVIVVAEAGNRPVRPPDNLLVPVGVDTLAGMADMVALDKVVGMADRVVDTVVVVGGSTSLILPQTNQWHLL